MLVFGSTLEISVDYEYPDYQENFKRIGPKTLMALQISGNFREKNGKQKWIVDSDKLSKNHDNMCTIFEHDKTGKNKHTHTQAWTSRKSTEQKNMEINYCTFLMILFHFRCRIESHLATHFSRPV